MAGELSGDGDRDDRAAFAAAFECLPAGVETAGAAVRLGLNRGRLAAAAPLERDARTEWSSLVPGGFD